MALEVRGVPILSYGEFRELTRGQDQEMPAHPVIVAWFAGEEVGPFQLSSALDVSERLAARDERAIELIDLAISRLTSAFPEESRGARSA